MNGCAVGGKLMSLDTGFIMKTNNGSSLLIFFMMTTFLSMLCFGYWYKTSLLVYLVNQREIYYKKESQSL